MPWAQGSAASTTYSGHVGVDRVHDREASAHFQPNATRVPKWARHG
jgi:hypothetical protein